MHPSDPRRTRTLLVTHEASLSGAPRVALLVARALAARDGSVTVVSRRPGPLLAAFAGVGRTSVEPCFGLRARLSRSRLVPAYVAAQVDLLGALLTIRRLRPARVYVSSSAAAVYARAAVLLGVPVVLHVHESADLVARFVDRDRARGALRTATLVACSPSVHADLAGLADVDPARVALLPSVPDDALVLERAQQPPDPAYPPGLVVGCCGSVERRKGADLWSALAVAVRLRVPDLAIRFVWVGEQREPVDATPDVEFLGPRDNPYPHLRRFDVAVLPSRDDPFPLVVLEAMLLGTPVVAFDVGAVAAQVGDTGIVVPPGDVAALADAVAALLQDDDERRRLGRAARTRASATFSTAAFLDGLDTLLDDAGSPAYGRAGRG